MADAARWLRQYLAGRWQLVHRSANLPFSRVNRLKSAPAYPNHTATGIAVQTQGLIQRSPHRNRCNASSRSGLSLDLSYPGLCSYISPRHKKGNVCRLPLFLHTAEIGHSLDHDVTHGPHLPTEVTFSQARWRAIARTLLHSYEQMRLLPILAQSFVYRPQHRHTGLTVPTVQQLRLALHSLWTHHSEIAWLRPPRRALAELIAQLTNTRRDVQTPGSASVPVLSPQWSSSTAQQGQPQRRAYSRGSASGCCRRPQHLWIWSCQCDK